jgi:AraC-like DNA-binding protein
VELVATIFSEKMFQKFEKQFGPYLSELNIPEAVFTRRDVEVSDVQYVELLETVARESNPYIGLEMGGTLKAKDLGVMGHAVSATANIGEALKIFSTYIYVFAQSNVIRLDIGGDRAVFTYNVTILQPDLCRQDAEFAIAFTTSFIRDLSEREFRPNLVEFAHTQLESAKPHQDLFGCEVKFDRRANRIHFNTKVFDYPVCSNDPGLLEALQFYLDDRMKVRSEDDDLLSKVRHLVSISLGDDGPNHKKVASNLGMSSRTLQRKLAEQNTAFSDLVDSIRSSVAMEYVRHTDYSLTDVALMLGYAELSSFSRAFKRWNGVNPQQARETVQQIK